MILWSNLITSSSSRIYCSDACQALDDSSPSLSAASSAWPSPSLPPVATGSTHELPSLTLGMSLATKPAVYPPSYPIWYDEEDDADLLSVHPMDDTLLRPYDALSYARRPGGTNTHSTIPLLHRHSSSSTSTGHSANSAEEDSDISGPTSSRHHRRRSYGTPLRPTAPLPATEVPDAVTTITSRKRNRASLPAYFSLLTLGAPHAKSSVTMSPPRSSADTARSRPSPTIPRLARATIDHTHAVAGASPSSAPLLALDPEEYRGRRRQPGSTSRARSRSPSRSRSHSRSREWTSGREGTRGRRRLDELDGWVADREYGYGRGRSGLRDRAERGLCARR
jgi:hypothetical protein